ncbi:hypothetical protein BDZ45DRAFT_751922 [Acephala macrosclerotiorum]|nr:hypothetical protein BDZ45DRAFT_751922 [Acephala macrosclerotiorum]
MPSLFLVSPPASDSAPVRTSSPASGMVAPPRQRNPVVGERRRGRRRTNVQISNDGQTVVQTTGRRFQRPANDQPDPSEDFLRLVLASNPPQREERDATTGYFEETSTSLEQQRSIYSFADGQPPSWQVEEEFYRERAALRVRESAVQSGVNIVLQLLWIAMRDCLDLRDARALLNQWASYHEDSVQCYPNIPDMVPPAALAFWVALRRGWGQWTPIERHHRELREVRNLLQIYTEFDHIIGRETNRITEDELLSRVRLSTLSPEEQAVFEIMIEERQVALNRIAQLYRNWAMFAPSIDDNSRQGSEQHLSRNQLRMDRLSRLIREERVINSDHIEVEPSSRSFSPFLERLNDQRERPILRRTFHRPLHEVPDAGETYLRLLLTVLVGSSYHGAGTSWTGRRFDEGIPSMLWMGETMLDANFDNYDRNNYRLRYCLAERWQESTNVVEEYNEVLDYLTTITSEIEATLLRTVIGIAMADGMSMGEAAAFLFYWMILREQDADVMEHYPSVPTMLPTSIIMFWFALRRGWSRWRPSLRMLNKVREFLQQNTSLNHAVVRQADGDNVDSEEELDVLANIESSVLPDVEKERLRKLVDDEQMTGARINRVFENWVAYEAIVEDTRLASEEHFSRAELRLDRLERIIREERIVNARRTLGRWGHVHGRDESDGSDYEE